MPKIIRTLLFLCLSFLAVPASASDTWAQSVVNTTVTLMNGHCVSSNAPNTVYLLNAPSGQHMSKIDERKAMSALTMAFLNHGRFQVTRGNALIYESYMSENTAAGRQKLEDTVARLTNSTITIFFVPVHRAQNRASADIVFLTRTNGNGDIQLGCAPTITLDVPIRVTTLPPPPIPDVAGFIADFHDAANTWPCTEMARFYAPTIVVAGKTRTLAEQIQMRCEINMRNPAIHLHRDTIQVTVLGNGRYRVNYSNTSEIDGENGGRTTTDWFLDSIVEEQNGQLKFTQVDLASSRR